MKRNTPTTKKPISAPLGYLPTPHGSTPWHFRHEGLSGNGFNGGIRHMWREPPSLMAMPGLGLIHNAPQ